jgi:beta-glucosidase/6-phospho-beta-glucosidase/beta-galactosidase
MRHKALTATALAAASVVIGPVSGAHAARGMEVALQDDPVFLDNSWYGRDLGFQRARELGVSRLRVNFSWAREVASSNSKTQPATPTYNWGKFDSLIAQAAANGIKVQLTLTGPAPAWATSNHRIGNVKPKPAAFGRLAADVAAHFKGRVDRYGIWNEPNWKSWLEPHKSSPGIYRGMYKAAYGAIKRADRNA